MIKLLVTLLVLVSCQKQKPKEPKQRSPEVSAKAELYKSLHKGWAHDKCDSLGFTALCKLASGCQLANIMDAEGVPGRWYRSPEHDCYDLGQSKSDISKDMFVMLFAYLYASGDKQNLEEIYDYGERNGWVMGRGDYSRTFMTPTMVAFLQELLGRFGVQIMPSEEKEKAGYEKHLDAIHILTAAMKRGGIYAQDLELLKSYSKESPRNALYAALYHRFKDGDQSQAISILMDKKLFPSDRLPTTADRCEEYLWQRDDSPKDWGPCDKGSTHDGNDFLVAAWVAGQI